MTTQTPPTHHNSWHGLFVAAVTPLDANYKPDPQALPGLLDFYARRGCHGALLFGTTGEGPSFNIAERRRLLDAAAEWRASHPDFRIMVGVGMPSLGAAIELTQATFTAGLDGVMCLPPYYFREASADGLTEYFDRLIGAAVPETGGFFFYHFPRVSGIAVPHATIAAMLNHYPNRVTGLKDSSGDLVHLQALRARFPQLRLFPGNDSIMAAALELGAAGAITALGNVYSPHLRALYDRQQAGQDISALQAQIITAQQALSAGPAGAPVMAKLKLALHRRYGFPHWPTSPPLAGLPDDTELPLMAHLSDGD